jgi:hypothetical protein
MYAGLFHWLRRFSAFTIVRHFIPDKHYHVFVDCYLLAHLTIAVLCFSVLPAGRFNLVTVLLLAYGAWRCFELIVLHVNQVLFDEYRVLRDGLPVDDLNYRRLVLSIIHNYVELLFWFAFFYRQLAFHFSRQHPLEDPWTALYFSVVTQATVGYGDVTPTDWIGRALVIAQVALGIFLVIAVLARWMSIMRDTQRRDKIT